jgi:4'-phosphopantetheinyl transferase
MPSLLAINDSHALEDPMYDRFLNVVSPERKRKASRFLRREDACRSLVGEALARFCIGRRENVPAASIVFQYNDHGKPSADLPGKTQFSISHSHSWVVCALDEGAVGVDIEYIHDHDLDIAKRFFHPREYSEMLYLPQAQRKERFFALWTLKESYIKAIGKGLSCPLDSFAIVFERDLPSMQMDENLQPLFFKQYEFGPHYKCALCLSKPDFPPAVETLTPQELLRKLVP